MPHRLLIGSDHRLRRRTSAPGSILQCADLDAWSRHFADDRSTHERLCACRITRHPNGIWVVEVEDPDGVREVIEGREGRGAQPPMWMNDKRASRVVTSPGAGRTQQRSTTGRCTLGIMRLEGKWRVLVSGTRRNRTVTANDGVCTPELAARFEQAILERRAARAERASGGAVGEGALRS